MSTVSCGKFVPLSTLQSCLYRVCSLYPIECALSNVPLLTLALPPSPTQANFEQSHSGRRSSCTSPPQSSFGLKHPINKPADARAQYDSIDQHWEASRLGKSERQGAHAAATANLDQTGWANEKNQRTSTDVQNQRTSTDVQDAERAARASWQPMQLQAGREHTGIAINEESSGHTDSESSSDESCSDKFGTYSESSESEIETAGERSQSASDDALVQQQQKAQILKIPLQSVFI
jgi:hypothetical protein